MSISLCSLFLLGAMFLSPQTGGNASGTFTVDDKTTELRYARSRSESARVIVAQSEGPQSRGTTLRYSTQGYG
jgi:hypothetical protein